jgi:hypothetical protein
MITFRLKITSIMRQLSFTILLFFGLTTPLLAQDEYPFLTEGKQWVQEEFNAGFTDTAFYSYFELSLGDTVMVDGVAYTQLVGDTSDYPYHSGLLRETDGRLLILRNQDIDTLMDFNLEVGDTIILEGDYSEPEHTQHMVLLSMDSVTVLDGSIRKRLNFELNNVGFDGGGFGVSWIDGIGSTRGTIFNSFCSTNTQARFTGTCQSELICVKDADNRLLYNSTEDEIYDCNKVDVISSVPSYRLPEGTFELYPNPAGDFVFVEGNTQYPISRLVLTDMNGRRVTDETFAFPTAEHHRIGLTNLPKGMYNLTIFTAEGEWSSLRVVKQ